MSEDEIPEAASENQPVEDEAQAGLAPDTAQGQDGISEAASENQDRPKRKRGRPPVWTPAGREMGKDSSRARTARGQSNHLYAIMAQNQIKALCDQAPDEQACRAAWERMSWLANQTTWILSQPRLSPLTAVLARDMKVRLSVLTELGRIYFDLGEEAFRRALDSVLDMQPKPTTKAAVAMLRRWRLECLGKPDEDCAGDADELSIAIQKAIEGYLERYPATSDETILEALNDMVSLHLFVMEEKAKQQPATPLLLAEGTPPAGPSPPAG
jgi:hypothetical protein